MIESLLKHLSDPALVPNNGGGLSFVLDDWGRLERFLILGAEGGTYYASERKLTLENAAVAQRCIAADGVRTVAVVQRISVAGRAPKNDAAIFVLALCMKLGDEATKQAARLALLSICRTGTHLFQLMEALKSLKVGWGRGQRSAVANWYTGAPPANLAYQLVKYKQRNGWSHRDVLRLCHAGAPVGATADLLYYAVKGWPGVGIEPHPDKVLQVVWAAKRAQVAELPEVLNLITDYRLPWEVVRSEHLREPAVWRALLPHLGLGALVRNLGRMTACGALGPLSEGARVVVERLGDVEAIRRARLHPIAILNALRVYGSGCGIKGDLIWSPNSAILAALDAAFSLAFEAVPVMNKRVLLALDVSGSMTWSTIAGMAITPREASAALALVTARREPQHEVVAFASGLSRLAGVGSLDLTTFLHKIEGLPMSATDCSLPMIYAQQHHIPVDAFVIFTDSETNSNRIPPSRALREYRQALGIPAKLIVCAMTSTGFTIANPADGGSLDVVGFDTAVPALIHDFVVGSDVNGVVHTGEDE